MYITQYSVHLVLLRVFNYHHPRGSGVGYLDALHAFAGCAFIQELQSYRNPQHYFKKEKIYFIIKHRVMPSLGICQFCKSKGGGFF